MLMGVAVNSATISVSCGVFAPMLMGVAVDSASISVSCRVFAPMLMGVRVDSAFESSLWDLASILSGADGPLLGVSAELAAKSVSPGGKC